MVDFESDRSNLIVRLFSPFHRQPRTTMNNIEITAGTVLATNNTAQPLEILAPVLPNSCAAALADVVAIARDVAETARADRGFLTHGDVARLMDDGAPMSVTTLLTERGNF
jgi:hypothetical protein